jgi:hypothetical protein
MKTRSISKEEILEQTGVMSEELMSALKDAVTTVAMKYKEAHPLVFKSAIMSATTGLYIAVGRSANVSYDMLRSGMVDCLDLAEKHKTFDESPNILHS